ncbi:MAG: 50S ribosomal protein L18 [Candidatus Hinthialibacter antarcticus]|nr:50S ribosomal protein L18 [Candidatus Hinthialibacter antarcticus]
MKNRHSARKRRQVRVRKKISGTAERPRLNIFRSHKHIYVQAIDDVTGKTIAAASSLIQELPNVESEEAITNKRMTARKVGVLLAKKLEVQGVTSAVFDRGGYLYHGRVQALADGVREGGLKF